MIWGCIISKGVGRLEFISGTVNAEMYVKTLKECLEPVARNKVKSKAVPLHAMEALGRRGGIAPTHSRPRH
jgi:hypothetical protein